MIKILLTYLIFLGSFNCLKAQDLIEMDSINHLIDLNVNKLDSIFKDCDTHYALIKMEVDKNNKIQDVSSLNKISSEFLSFFTPMKDCIFPKNKNSKKTILFIYVVYSLNKCKPEKISAQKTIENLLPEMTILLARQMKNNPRTLYEGVIASDFGFPGKK